MPPLNISTRVVHRAIEATDDLDTLAGMIEAIRRRIDQGCTAATNTNIALKLNSACARLNAACSALDDAARIAAGAVAEREARGAGGADKTEASDA